MLRRIFKAQLSARNFTGGGFSLRMESFGGNFRVSSVFFVGGTSYEGVSRKEREFFMEGEPDIPQLFEKPSQIKRQAFSTESKEQH